MNKRITLTTPTLLVIMGVSGCGKSSVANAVASSGQFTLVEADDFHSKQAKDFMASGRPLDNEMRKPWVAALCQHLQDHYDDGTSCVMAFSGLAKQHRDTVRALPFDILFVHLVGDQATIQQRSEIRSDHFMPASLLASQYLALEETPNEGDVVTVSVEQDLDQVIEQVNTQTQQYFMVN